MGSVPFYTYYDVIGVLHPMAANSSPMRKLRPFSNSFSIPFGHTLLMDLVNVSLWLQNLQIDVISFGNSARLRKSICLGSRSSCGACPETRGSIKWDIEVCASCTVKLVGFPKQRCFKLSSHHRNWWYYGTPDEESESTTQCSWLIVWTLIIASAFKRLTEKSEKDRTKAKIDILQFPKVLHLFSGPLGARRYIGLKPNSRKGSDNYNDNEGNSSVEMETKRVI